MAKPRLAEAKPPATLTVEDYEPQPDIEEQVRLRAYEIFLERNGGPGSELDDWLQAETEIRSRRIAA